MYRKTLYNNNAKPKVDKTTCKCQACGRRLYRKAAYAVRRGLTTEYYCLRQEYNGGKKYIDEVNKYDPKIHELVLLVLDVAEIDPVEYNSELATWLSRGTPKKVYGYIYENRESFRLYIKNKNIENPIYRLHYFSAIINNGVGEYRVREDTKEDEPVAIMDMSTKIDVDVYEPKTTPRAGLRRSLADLEDQL